MKNIPEEVLDFKSLEKTVFSTVCQFGQKMIMECLRIWDLQIMALRDIDEYRAVNSGTTTIKTLMGEIIYTRRRYKKKSGGYVFLLDEALGIEKGCGLISENLAEQIIALCADKSFRKASESINSFTGQKISAMGTWNVLQQFGGKLDKQEERMGELYRSGTVGQLGNIACQVLFSELDDVWLSMQKEKRLKKGGSAGTRRRKIGKRPMHIGTAYSGWNQAKDGKYRLLDKFAYARFGTSSEFASDFEMLLCHRFDMDGVKQWILNGDGANWIKTVADNNDAILQLDPFHRSRAVMRAVADKDDRKMLFGAIKDKDVRKSLAVIAELTAKETDEQSRKKLVELFEYFHNNKDSLLTWKERGIELPKPSEGVFYRSLGTQESSNCDLITQRMKHRKGSWSEKGANNMAKILCYRNTIGLDTVLGIIPAQPKPMTSKEPLSAAKTPLYDGKGYDGSWLYAPMPFEQTYATNGRDAIRNLVKLRLL
jgi:hypothetical protein